MGEAPSPAHAGAFYFPEPDGDVTAVELKEEITLAFPSARA